MIKVKIIADSIAKTLSGLKRITTYELEYPRFIHSEFMTHRLFSRNAASSRAIPVNKMIDNVIDNTAIPIHWGKNQRGMQAKEECHNPVLINDEEKTTEEAWNCSRDKIIEVARAFTEAGYHKQIVNRLLEPYQNIKVICTATEYDNFFYLRYHEDAQPEIMELAKQMYHTRENNKPQYLLEGEWHLPYINEDIMNECLSFSNNSKEGALEVAKKVSASCCAQVSYRTLNAGVEKALKIYNALVESKPVHASPFEHQATPISSYNSLGITHTDCKRNLWSGNFNGWVQYRQLISNNTCWKFNDINDTTK